MVEEIKIEFHFDKKEISVTASEYLIGRANTVFTDNSD